MTRGQPDITVLSSYYSDASEHLSGVCYSL